MWFAEELQFRTLQGLCSAERRTGLIVCDLPRAMESQHKLCGTGGFHLPLINDGIGTRATKNAQVNPIIPSPDVMRPRAVPAD